MSKNTTIVLVVLMLVVFLLVSRFVSLGKEAVEVIREANQPLIMVYPDWGNDMSDEVWKPTK
jgi:L-ribulose-5-phosphate 3-epimerase UlaE